MPDIRDTFIRSQITIVASVTILSDFLKFKVKNYVSKRHKCIVTFRLFCKHNDLRFVYITTKTRRFRVSLGHLISKEKNQVPKTSLPNAKTPRFRRNVVSWVFVSL